MKAKGGGEKKMGTEMENGERGRRNVNSLTNSRGMEPNGQTKDGGGKRRQDQKMKEKVAMIQLTLLGTRM